MSNDTDDRPGKKLAGLNLAAFAKQFFGDDQAPLGSAPNQPSRDPQNCELPPDCPVIALGYQIRTFYYLNLGGQLVELLDKEHSRNVILALFGGSEAYLEKIWPKYSKPDRQGFQKVIGWMDDWVAGALMRECVRQGPWQPLERMRGPGAWLGEEGKLVMHFGDYVLIDGETHMPGAIDGFIYEGGAKRPRPSQQFAAGGPCGPGAEILSLLETWNWRRPEVDPYLMLGHIVAGKVGGALPWRPIVWVVGPAGAGKSTLDDRVLWPLYGRDGCIHLSDPSEAAVRQLVRYSTLPVIVDEIERSADRRRVQSMVSLARLAASGGLTARGSAVHVAFQFVVRSSFTFSSIYAAPLNAQDRSRIAVLELAHLVKGCELPDLADKRLRDLGRLLTRRIIDQWPRFPATFDCFRKALLRGGHDPRGADQYGVLAACAYLALHDGEPCDTPLPEDETARAETLDGLRPGDLAFWEHRFAAARLAEESDDEHDYQRCLDHLLGALADPRRAGERRTIGQVIEDLATQVHQIGEIRSELLDATGLKLIMEPLLSDGTVIEPVLVVANQHRGLFEIYADTAWAGSAGASGAGWVQALRRTPQARPDEAMRFAGVKSRVTKLSLQSWLGCKRR